MKRRNITIGGRAISDYGRFQAEKKERLKDRFKDSAYVDAFLDRLIRSGWDELDLETAVRQAENLDRPALEAFMLNNEHVIDQLTLNQATYTHFRDTAADPNYALRHRGQFELIMRRMTPGDLMMLHAAHWVSLKNGDEDVGSVELNYYWNDLWHGLLHQMPEHRALFVKHQLGGASGQSASLAVDFALLTIETGTALPLTAALLQETFCDPMSRFFCGVQFTQERVRHGDEYGNWRTFTRIDNGDESLFMFACVVFCYAVDNEARAYALGEKRWNHTNKFYQQFVSILRDGRGSEYRRTQDNANPETNAQTGPIDTGRLLP